MIVPFWAGHHDEQRAYFTSSRWAPTALINVLTGLGEVAGSSAIQQISCHLSLRVSGPGVPDLPGVRERTSVLDDFPPSLYGQINSSM